MRILITGCSGYVGGILSTGLKERFELIGLDSSPLASDIKSYRSDISDLASLRKHAGLKPDFVIHAVGNKDIAFCEANPAAAMKSNCDTVLNICRTFPNSRIIYLSTDYVFDGMIGDYTESSNPSPATVYGKSKLCGEIEGIKLAGERFLVLRMAALYNTNAQFIHFLFKNLSVGIPVECFDDVVYSPTYYKDLLSGLALLTANWPPNDRILHITGAPVTRLGFARLFAEAFGFNPNLVLPVKSSGRSNFMFPNLSLNCTHTARLLNLTITDTKTALADLKRDIKNENTSRL